jgi:hypothetical protein
MDEKRVQVRSTQCCGSGIRCSFDPWNRDGKKPGFGSEMNILDHFSEFMRYPGSDAFLTPGWIKIKIRIPYEHPGSYFQVFGNNFLG